MREDRITGQFWRSVTSATMEMNMGDFAHPEENQLSLEGRGDAEPSLKEQRRGNHVKKN